MLTDPNTFTSPPFPCDLKAAIKRQQPQTLRWREIIAQPEHLSCKLILGQRWREQTTDRWHPAGQHGFQTLAGYSLAGRSEATLRIMVATLPYEVTPADWLAVLHQALGYQPLQQRVFKTPGDELPDYLTRLENDTEPSAAILHRSTALKDGNRLFVVEAAAPAAQYTALAEAFLIGLASFKLTHPKRVNFAESIVPYAWGAVPLRFARPATWRVHLTPPRDGLEIGLKLEHEHPCGLIEVFAANPRQSSKIRPTATQLFTRVMNRVQAEHTHVETISRQTGSGTRWIVGHTVVLGKLRDVTAMREFRLEMLNTTTTEVCLLSRCPQTKQHPAAAAIHRRAFNILRDSLQIGIHAADAPNRLN